MIDVAGNVARVRERVGWAAERSGRTPDSIRIIAASKTKPATLITQAIAAGIRDVGENYVQEAARKIEAVKAPIRWHMIGHLQRNKAARAAQLFAFIHTVDDLSLARALDQRAARLGRTVRVLIEVNVGAEASKSGVAPERLDDLAAEVVECRHLRLDGLMTVPPLVEAEAARPYFAKLRELRDATAKTLGIGLGELSMGMSDDFEVAIEEGATMVRVGRAIFGARNRGGED